MTDAQLSQRIVEAAARLAPIYSAVGRYTDDVLTQYAALCASRLPDGTGLVFDVGIGSGHPTTFLARTLTNSIVGVDISFEMLVRARQTLGGRVNYVVAQAANLPFQNGIASMVTSVSALHLFPDKRAAVREIRRILRPDGVAVLADISPDDLARQVFHRYFRDFHVTDRSSHFSENQIRLLVAGAGLELIESHRLPYSVEFRSLDDLLDFVASRPFFGLQTMDDQTFNRGYERFCRDVEVAFPRGPIPSETALTVYVLKAVA